MNILATFPMAEQAQLSTKRDSILACTYTRIHNSSAFLIASSLLIAVFMKKMVPMTSF